MPKTTKITSKNKPNYLVCVSSEKHSEAALNFTCNLAKKNKGTVTLLHVIEPSDFQSLGAIADKIRIKQRDESQELLLAIAATSKKRFGIMPAIAVREGFIEDEIISLVEEDNTITMLIAEASPSNSKTSKTIPSLVASVGNKLCIPVLIVPSTCREQQIKGVG